MWARWQVRDLASDSGNLERPWYPTYKADAPIIVIDTLSLALGGEDEKGPRVVGFINECLDLIKWLPDINNPHDRNTDPDKFDKWNEDNPDLEYFTSPAASHIIIIHHQTKTGNDFAGHRAVGANTQNIYRVHRSGKISDASRPFAGQLTPVRTKDIMRPAPISFEVDVVSVEGTKRTAAILKDKAKAIPKKLEPIIKALRKLDDHEEIRREDLNACLDEVSKSTGSAQRAARKRNRESLEAAGVLVPVEDDSGKVAFYRFHDTGAT
tara:strand:- start:608 stop:1408 length:801 start_codon:yes stop_codon:yes gene_type:complete